MEDLTLVNCLYDSGISYADSQIDRLLSRLDEFGLLDNTLVVVTSDHGESLGEKGLFKHAVRGRLPEAIRQRKKKGFSAPVKQWFTRADLFKLIADVRAEHPDLAAAWLHPRLAWNARTITGTRGYKLWIFLKWIQRNA